MVNDLDAASITNSDALLLDRINQFEKDKLQSENHAINPSDPIEPPTTAPICDDNKIQEKPELKSEPTETHEENTANEKSIFSAAAIKTKPIDIDPTTLQIIDEVGLRDYAAEYANEPKIRDFKVRRTDSLERILKILPQIKNRRGDLSSTWKYGYGQVPMKHISSDVHLTADIFLIMDLLTMDASKVEQHLLKLAKPLLKADKLRADATEMLANISRDDVNESMVIVVDLLSNDKLRRERLQELAIERLSPLKALKEHPITLLRTALSKMDAFPQKIDVQIAATQAAESTPAAAAAPKKPLLDAVNLQHGDEIEKVLQAIKVVAAVKEDIALPERIRLNAENLMLLDLLSCETDIERETFIIQMAQRRRLLVINSETDEIELNPALLQLSGVMNTKMLSLKLKAEKPPIVDPVVVVPVVKEYIQEIHGGAIPKRSKEIPTVLDARRSSTSSIKKPTIEVAAASGTFRNLSESEITDQATAPPSAAAKKEKRKKPPKKELRQNKEKPSTLKITNVEELHLANQKIMCDLLAKMQIKPTPAPVEPLTEKRRKRGERKRHRSRDRDQSATSSFSPTTAHSSIAQVLDDITDRVDSLDMDQNTEDCQQILLLVDQKVQALKQKLRTAQEKLRNATQVKSHGEQRKPPQKVNPNFKDEVNQQHYALTKDCSSFFSGWKLDDNVFELDVQSNVKSIEEYAAQLVERGHGTCVDAEIRVNQFNYYQAYISRGASHRDALIKTVILRQCSMHGDLVRAFVYNDNYSGGGGQQQQQQPPDVDADERRAEPARAFVVRILERRHDRQVMGHCTLNANKKQITLYTTNKRLPIVQILKSTIPETFPLNDQILYSARITNWSTDYKPIGVLVRAIGDRNTLTTCNEAILLENKLEVPAFSQQILDALPSDSYRIPADEYDQRENLTAECVFTIDPATARDLDDAMSCKQLANGNYEIGVHISDVTHFLKEFSELDMCVKEQATSIYLVDQVYHMLPRSLCMTCSLLPGEDKVTFSVFWEMDKFAKVISTRFARTIINSCAQLAYSHAQQMIDEPNRQFGADDLPPIGNGFSVSHISHVVNTLHGLAKIMRKQRYDRMCIKIDQPKITFQLDPDTGEPISFEKYRQQEANSLIEEFMLFANQSVASLIYEKYPNISILRNHAPPKPSGLEGLAAKLKQFNFKLDISSSKAISESFYRIVTGVKHTEAVTCVLNEWLAKPMNRAEYYCSEMADGRAEYLWHFALSIPIYTHFTSPIRRYPDILVHRLLAAALCLAAVPERTPDELHKIATRCNVQKYNAKLAGEDSTALYFMHYIRAREAVQMRAVVTEMQAGDWIEALLMDTGNKVKVPLTGTQTKHKLKLEITSARPRAGLVRFTDLRGATPVKVQVFAEVLVEVTVKDNKLMANLVPKY